MSDQENYYAMIYKAPYGLDIDEATKIREFVADRLSLQKLPMQPTSGNYDDKTISRIKGVLSALIAFSFF